MSHDIPEYHQGTTGNASAADGSVIVSTGETTLRSPALMNAYEKMRGY